MTPMRHYLRLDGWERIAVCRLFLLQLHAGLLLRLLGIKRAGNRLAVLTTTDAHKFPAGFSAAEFADRCHALSGAGRTLGLFRNNCLGRSLALKRFLSRYGIQTTIRLGVVPGSTPLLAHAWLEFNGTAIGGEDLQSFRMLEDLDDLAGVAS